MRRTHESVVQAHLFRIALIATLLLTSTGLNAGLPSKALDAEFLRTLEWTDIKSVKMLVSNWSHNESSSETHTFPNHPDLSVVDSGQLEIDGIVFDAAIQHFGATGLHRVVFAAGSGSNDYKASTRNMEFCSRQAGLFNDQYGETPTIYDLSRPTSTQTATVDMRGQWDIGETRVVFKCFALKMYEGFVPIIFLSYGHRSSIDSLVMPLHILCSVNQKGTGIFEDENVSQNPPFQLTILDDREEIISRKNLGKVQHFSDQSIITSMSNDKKKIESTFKLNRVTGTYEWEIVSTQDSSVGGSGLLLWGQCEKVSSDSRL